MVITSSPSSLATRRLGALVGVYVAVVVATLVALAVLTAAGSAAAGTDAWVHAVIVGVFALVLPLRLRAAQLGSTSALRAVAIIAGVLVLVNVVEALVPGLFPLWMRIEMVGLAVLLAVIGALAVRTLRR